MSYVFESEDKDLWSPSNIVAGMFLSQLKQLTNLVNKESGLEETMSGVIEVNPSRLRDFLSTTSNYLNDSNNTSLRVLLRPVVIHLIAIYLRCEITPQIDFAFASDWCVEAKLLAEKGMPR